MNKIMDAVDIFCSARTDMYVLLNLKDGSRLTDVVQLLFAHGHTAVSVAERIEDLCPTCERAGAKAASNPTDSPATSSAASSVRESNRPETNLTASSSQPGEAVVLSPCFGAGSNGGQAPVMFQKQEQQRVPLPPTEPAEVKEEPSEFAETKASISEQASSSSGGQFSITSALELLGHASTSNMEQDLELDASDQGGRVNKRKARIEKLGLETFQCQLCKKAITRQGQYANLVNHLSRHARLHASKKQYCCPVCRASFTRRYLAYAHLKEAHPSTRNVDPLDHGRELREEYRALLEVCFPGASSRRKKPSTQYGENGKHDAGNVENDDSHDINDCGVLSQLLEQ